MLLPLLALVEGSRGLFAAPGTCATRDKLCLHDSVILKTHKNTSDPALCCAACEDNASCVAWNVNNETDICYLRSTYVQTPDKDGKCISGQLRVDDQCGAGHISEKICFNTSPNLGKPTYTTDAASCCAACKANPACAGWTWGFDAKGPVPGTLSCRLKSAISEQPKTGNCTSGCTAGDKACGHSPEPAPPTPPPPTSPPTPIPAPTPPPPPAESKQPHIVMILVDDFGWANAGWHRAAGYAEVQTPNMDALIAEGIELDRAYTYKFCSPSRSSLQSGRLPVHVNMVNAPPDVSNPADRVAGFAAIPRNMTGIATKLRAAGYRTHQVGKWDAGMATFDHTPAGRGYDTSFGYFHHANDYWTEQTGSCVDSKQKKRLPVDLWDTDHGASSQNGTREVGSVEGYEEWKFEQHVLRVIGGHDASNASAPLFLNYDFHIVHEPMQVPDVFLDKFAFIAKSSAKDYKTNRQHYHAMVNFADGVLGNVTDALKAKGMWGDTLLVLQSDNGGPSFAGSSHTANNYPLKGTKMANWEGGVRTNAFVSGGFLQQFAPSRVGSKLEGYVHVCDWYATFCALGGCSKHDERAAIANLPPVDSIDMWPYLSGKVDASPRTTIHMDTGVAVRGDLKLLVKESAQACWAGPQYPNGTADPACNRQEHCNPCLYNISADPSEYTNLAADPAHAADLESMTNLVASLDATIFNPSRGKADPLACDQADKNGNFWGPWIE